MFLISDVFVKIRPKWGTEMRCSEWETFPLWSSVEKLTLFQPQACRGETASELIQLFRSYSDLVTELNDCQHSITPEAYMTQSLEGLEPIDEIVSFSHHLFLSYMLPEYLSADSHSTQRPDPNRIETAVWVHLSDFSVYFVYKIYR